MTSKELPGVLTRWPPSELTGLRALLKPDSDPFCWSSAVFCSGLYLRSLQATFWAQHDQSFMLSCFCLRIAEELQEGSMGGCKSSSHCDGYWFSAQRLCYLLHGTTTDILSHMCPGVRSHCFSTHSVSYRHNITLVCSIKLLCYWTPLESLG